MGSGEFIRIGDAARLLAFHLGQRFQSHGHAHLGTARDRLLGGARDGAFPIIAGTRSWSGAGVYALPAECVRGLAAANIDWDASTFDASSGVPVAATAVVRQLHSGPATLWVPLEDFSTGLGIDAATFDRWSRR